MITDIVGANIIILTNWQKVEKTAASYVLRACPDI